MSRIRLSRSPRERRSGCPGSTSCMSGQLLHDRFLRRGYTPNWVGNAARIREGRRRCKGCHGHLIRGPRRSRVAACSGCRCGCRGRRRGHPQPMAGRRDQRCAAGSVPAGRRRCGCRDRWPDIAEEPCVCAAEPSSAASSSCWSLVRCAWRRKGPPATRSDRLRGDPDGRRGLPIPGQRRLAAAVPLHDAHCRGWSRRRREQPHLLRVPFKLAGLLVLLFLLLTLRRLDVSWPVTALVVVVAATLRWFVIAAGCADEMFAPMLWVGATMWLLVGARGDGRPSLAAAGVLGILSGVLAYEHPAYLPVVALAGGWLVWRAAVGQVRRGASARAWAAPALFLAVLLTTACPLLSDLVHQRFDSAVFEPLRRHVAGRGAWWAEGSVPPGVALPGGARGRSGSRRRGTRGGGHAGTAPAFRGVAGRSGARRVLGRTKAAAAGDAGDGGRRNPDCERRRSEHQRRATFGAPARAARAARVRPR